jgi:hypothetical protein
VPSLRSGPRARLPAARPAVAHFEQTTFRQACSSARCQCPGAIPPRGAGGVWVVIVVTYHRPLERPQVRERQRG